MKPQLPRPSWYVRHFWWIYAGLLALMAVGVFFSPPIFAQTITAPTRTSSYDWQCQDASGAKLSDHTRFDTAFVACYNNPAGDRIVGGTYKLPARGTTPPPLPPTTPATAMVYSTTVGGTYENLHGARVSGAISVRLAGDCSTAFGSTGPWTFSVDDVARNTESQCPYALIDDNALFDTVALTNGSHTIKAVSGATTVSATFTVANAPPPPATGSATLTWIAPTTNTDGSALTNLAGYRICRGSSATTLTDCRPHMFPTATTATWTGLASGTHWFAVRAVNAAGAESVLSNAMSKVVP